MISAYIAIIYKIMEIYTPACWYVELKKEKKKGKE